MAAIASSGSAEDRSRLSYASGIAPDATGGILQYLYNITIKAKKKQHMISGSDIYSADSATTHYSLTVICVLCYVE